MGIASFAVDILDLGVKALQVVIDPERTRWHVLDAADRWLERKDAEVDKFVRRLEDLDPDVRLRDAAEALVTAGALLLAVPAIEQMKAYYRRHQ